jgi:hypothetical protein
MHLQVVLLWSSKCHSLWRNQGAGRHVRLRLRIKVENSGVISESLLFASKADIVLHVHPAAGPYVPREQADAIARMEENTLIVQWVQQCLERRISSYRWALERLVIQTPDTIAADADRLIGELAAQTANPPVAAQPVIGRAVTVKG